MPLRNFRLLVLPLVRVRSVFFNTRTWTNNKTCTQTHFQYVYSIAYLGTRSEITYQERTWTQPIGNNHQLSLVTKQNKKDAGSTWSYKIQKLKRKIKKPSTLTCNNNEQQHKRQTKAKYQLSLVTIPLKKKNNTTIAQNTIKSVTTMESNKFLSKLKQNSTP